MSRFLKTYKLVLWIVLALVVLPLLVTALYNRPTSDDISFARSMQESLPSNPTVFDIVGNAANIAANGWRASTGTFSCIFLYSVLWALLPNVWQMIYPFVLTLALLAAAFEAVRCLRAVRPALSRDAGACLALLSVLLFLLLMPDPYQGFFWYSGSNYIFSAALGVCVFSRLFRRCRAGARATVSEWFVLAGYCLLFFLFGGGDHINGTMFIVLYGFFALYALKNRKPIRYLLPLIFLIGGYLLAVLAPGNGVRAATHGEASSLLSAFLLSFVKAFQFAFRDARYWVFLVLCVPAAYAAGGSFSARHAALTGLASLSLMAACFFPLLWSGAYIAPRHTDRYFYLLCLLLPLNLTVWLGYLRQAHQGGQAPDALCLPAKQLWAWLAVATVALGLISVPNLTLSPLRLNCTVAPVNAAISLARGDTQRYAADYDALTAALRARPGEALIIQSCPSSALLGSPQLTDNPSDWRNQDFAAYYGGEGSSVAVSEQSRQATD